MIINQLALKLVHEEKGSLHGQRSEMLPEKIGLSQLLPESSCLYLAGYLNRTFHMWLLTVFPFSGYLQLSFDSQKY